MISNGIKSLTNKYYSILKYIFFVNNILIFPDKNNYYNNGVNTIPKIEDIIFNNDLYIQTEYNFFYDFDVKKLQLTFSFFIKDLFFNFIFDLEVNLLDFEILQEVDYKYQSLFSRIYNIEDNKKFEKDYINFIFDKYVKTEVKINQFNYNYYKLNKIIKD